MTKWHLHIRTVLCGGAPNACDRRLRHEGRVHPGAFPAGIFPAEGHSKPTVVLPWDSVTPRHSDVSSCGSSGGSGLTEPLDFGTGEGAGSPRARGRSFGAGGGQGTAVGGFIKMHRGDHGERLRVWPNPVSGSSEAFYGPPRTETPRETAAAGRKTSVCRRQRRREQIPVTNDPANPPAPCGG